VLDSTFATLTNVNFDATRFYDYMRKANTVRDELVNQAHSLGIVGESLQGPAHFKYVDNEDFLKFEAKANGIIARKALGGNPDALGVREMGQYGIKGTMAYFAHAERIRSHLNPKAYPEEKRNEVFSKLFKSLAMLAPDTPDLNDMVGNCLDIGGINLQAMELLDTAHTSTFGHPEPTNVTTIPTEGKCILISGHDIADLYQLLQKTEGTGINVYTHGEMLPAHAYPELKKFKHLKGHYGKAWQLQKIDFNRFPGAILLTSNCLVEPLPTYKNRIFTTNSVGFAGVKHINDCNAPNAFDELIAAAKAAPGFKASDCTKKTSTKDSFLIGFGHHTVLGVADKVLESIQKGELKDIFVIGGCDGSENDKRNYFTHIGENIPKDAIALTIGCGKFRINHHDFGTLPNGIPRLLDVGQCNDAYGAVKIALALASALKVDSVNKLPLHFAVSWFEQKAVAVLLTLLHLNVQNIYLGPYLPAFVTPNVLNVLVDKFKIHPTNADDFQSDLKQMLGR
jgi:hydroxylamine reductase